MSSITGVNSNFGFESLAVAMSKRQSDAQGEMVLDLLQTTTQSVQQINQAAASNGRVGSVIDVQA
ncbi:MAG TPA: hypothetical protein H9850_10550 [Candidatus Anaerobiospirillum pullistercoris]|uniref:Motility protein n=1 Tax=Candidatus Anaerobiospirillum pullistercoris TaxID=2838452 RepID=A0A9D2B1B4_9GAMM|nr:hypothetical protein [Candidatus Anaerobiospirillum pullistercoris]